MREAEGFCMSTTFGQRGIERPTEAVAQPVKQRRESMTPRDKRVIVGCINATWITLLIGGIIVWRLTAPPPTAAEIAQQNAVAVAEATQARADECRSVSNANLAFVMAQDPVRSRLKSPSTASFPWADDPLVSITTKRNCVFHVEGYVDAMNGFGATIRTRFIADMRLNEDATWSLVEVDL